MMCRRECLAGEPCDNRAACEQAEATYGPLFRARQLQLAEDRLLDLQTTCRDCQAASTWEAGDCAECGVAAERARGEAMVERLRREVQEGE